MKGLLETFGMKDEINLLKQINNRFFGVGVTDGCEPPCGSHKPNLRPQKEQPLPLTDDASLQSPDLLFIFICYLYVFRFILCV